MLRERESADAAIEERAARAVARRDHGRIPGVVAGPLILAIVYSFNAGSSITHWEGFSLRWWVGDPAAQESILYDQATRSALEHSLWLATLTTAIALPVGTAFAMG